MDNLRFDVILSELTLIASPLFEDCIEDATSILIWTSIPSSKVASPLSACRFCLYLLKCFLILSACCSISVVFNDGNCSMSAKFYNVSNKP